MNAWVIADESLFLPGWAPDPDNPVRYRQLDAAHVDVQGGAVWVGPNPDVVHQEPVLVLPEGYRPVMDRVVSQVSRFGGRLWVRRLRVDANGTMWPPNEYDVGPDLGDDSDYDYDWEDL